jgi:RNA polymerase sigma-70 factor (ECF subfamily)
MPPDQQSIYTQLLVLRCRRGDPAAWRDLLHLYEPRLFYYVRRLVDNEQDASDVLQQTWLGAFRNLHTLADPRALTKWLYQIAHHSAVTLLRRKSPHLSLDAPDPENPTDPPAPEPADPPLDNAEQVHHTLDQLPLPQRQVLTLHFLEDMPLAHIAEVLGVPEGTVKSRLFHAKRTLRQILDPQEPP